MTCSPGVLLKDQQETITFPESDSRLRSVDFACRARSIDGARIPLSAISDGEKVSRYDGYWGDQREVGIDRPAHVRTYESASLDDR